MDVKPTSDDQFSAAFAVLRAAAGWLEEQGRRQRISATTVETYRAWQQAGHNFVATDGDRIVGVFTVCREVLRDWPTVAPAHPVPFLRALAIHPEYRGQDVGALAVRSALDMVAPEALYLDCVSGFLPTYYARLGFEIVHRQTREYPDGDYDITLMRHDF